MQGDKRDTCLIPGLERCPGGGHGNSLQSSCLWNPMDRGAQQATVQRVAKSWTRLKWLSMHTHTCVYPLPLFRLSQSTELTFLWFIAGEGTFFKLGDQKSLSEEVTFSLDQRRRRSWGRRGPVLKGGDQLGPGRLLMWTRGGQAHMTGWWRV